MPWPVYTHHMQTTSPTATTRPHDLARKEATRVTLIGMVLDIVLGIAKIVGGVLGSSFALIADGIHSLTDASTDIFVLIVARVAYISPDRGHPYGHGRFEAIGTIAMGIVFFLTAGILIYDATVRLNSIEDLVLPSLGGAIIAALSIASKEWIYRFTLATANRLNSSLLRANAWHSRSDALSSIAVLIGIVGAQAGIIWLDAVAAIAVALLIARIGWDLCTESFSELVDGAVPDARRDEMESCLCGTQGVLGITELRTRLSGGRAIVEVHLAVDPRISVSEGHQIGAHAAQELKEKFEDISEVIPHIDPLGNPEHELSNVDASAIPTRKVIAEFIETKLKDETTSSSELGFDLHYLDSGIEIDLIVTEKSQTAIAECLADALVELPHVTCVRLLRKLATKTGLAN